MISATRDHFIKAVLRISTSILEKKKN